MWIIEKWKNRETKKKLREENIRLKAQLDAILKMPSPVVTVNRNIQRVKCSVEVSKMELEHGIPTGHIKTEIANKILECIMPFIEFDFSDTREHGGKIYTGTLYVATGNRRYE